MPVIPALKSKSRTGYIHRETLSENPKKKKKK